MSSLSNTFKMPQNEKQILNDRKGELSYASFVSESAAGTNSKVQVIKVGNLEENKIEDSSS